MITYRLNGHSRTMKGKGKQDILSLMTFVLRPKDCLGQRKSMTNVQVAVAVGIGKGHHEGLLALDGSRFKGIHLFPLLLDGDFIGAQTIAFGRTLGSRRDNGQVIHALGSSCFCF
jgi:hypothetical protein